MSQEVNRLVDSDGKFRLHYLQMEVGQWSRDNFGRQPSTNPLLGIVEEVGELSHAHLKGLQGIRHDSEEIREKKRDAVADILIYLCDYCERENIDLEGTVNVVWREVSKRNWVEDPKGAAE